MLVKAKIRIESLDASLYTFHIWRAIGFVWRRYAKTEATKHSSSSMQNTTPPMFPVQTSDKHSTKMAVQTCNQKSVSSYSPYLPTPLVNQTCAILSSPELSKPNLSPAVPAADRHYKSSSNNRESTLLLACRIPPRGYFPFRHLTNLPQEMLFKLTIRNRYCPIHCVSLLLSSTKPAR
jgi:Neuraminidase (sialidase)